MVFGGIRPKEFLNYPRVYILEAITKDDVIKEEEKEQFDK